MMSAIATQKQNHESQKEAWEEQMRILYTISKRNEKAVTKRREQICAYTEQIVNEALKTRIKQEINDTSIEMMLSTFLHKTLNCLKAENILPDSLKKELEKILSPQLSEELYEGAQMLFANGMKDLAIENNIKLLLDKECVQKELFNALGKNANECTCIEGIKEKLDGIRTDLELLQECEKTSKDVLQIGMDSRVLNMNLPHAISSFAIKDMNAYLASRNDIQQQKVHTIVNSLIGSKRKANDAIPHCSSSGWLSSLNPPAPKKRKFTPVTVQQPQKYQTYEVEDISDDENDVQIIPETPVKEIKPTKEDKGCQIGYPLSEYKEYFTKTIEEDEEENWKPSNKICHEKQYEITNDQKVAQNKLRKMTHDNPNKFKYICWNWNEKKSHNEECVNSYMCVLKHICMAELPTGGLCRSKDHTFIEHQVFYKYGQKEADFMKKHNIINEDQWNLIKHMSYTRKNQLKLIYYTDVGGSEEGQEFMDVVSREVVCSRMTGLEGKKVPYQLDFYNDE